MYCSGTCRTHLLGSNLWFNWDCTTALMNFHHKCQSSAVKHWCCCFRAVIENQASHTAGFSWLVASYAGCQVWHSFQAMWANLQFTMQVIIMSKVNTPVHTMFCFKYGSGFYCSTSGQCCASFQQYPFTPSIFFRWKHLKHLLVVN